MSDTTTPSAADLPDLPVDVEILSAGTSGAAAGLGGAAAEAGQPIPQLRELDKAPAHLRKAAMIVVIGALFPVMGHGGGWITLLLAKAVVFLALYFSYVYWVAREGKQKVNPTLAKLAALPLWKGKRKKPAREPRKPRPGATQAPMAVAESHLPFPSALHAISLVLLVVAVLIPRWDPGANFGTAAAEILMLAWGGATWVHIYGYERWGKFSPIFPLMFFAHAFAGIMAVLRGVQSEPRQILSALGGAIVAAGGLLAVFTIVEAMKQAKSEGDKKRETALEARRAARQK